MARAFEWVLDRVRPRGRLLNPPRLEKEHAVVCSCGDARAHPGERVWRTP